ncbi:MAG: hypothetical protein H6624_10375 [Bdellovibrionaceae bacterium]|nr:hypothetical protein [Pseudobdellovibrionaceae bacterium]
MAASLGSAVLMFLVFLGLPSCSRPSPLKGDPDLPAGRMTSTDKHVLIPDQLVKDLERSYLKNYRKNFADSDLTDGEVLARIPRRTLKLRAQLASSSPDVLVSPSSFEVGRGGGMLDLAEWVSGVRGDFFLSLKAELDESFDSSGLRVYFIGRAPGIEIDGKNWGLGCGRYADITKFYNRNLKTEGVRLNSTRNRYLYTIAGTFLFVYVEGENLHLSTISVTDSRYQDKLCNSRLTQSDDEEV